MERVVDRQQLPSGQLVDLSDAVDPGVVGAKAAALGKLLQAGFDVPGGFVIPAAAVAGAGDPGAQPDESFLIALATAMGPFGDLPLAVRSSGIAEDLDDASHAGQFETVLGVVGLSNVVAAVQTVAASAHATSLQKYREEIPGTAELLSAVAILIQPMINPDAAGVAFSANPVTGDRNEVVINAVAGLADRLMDGEALAEEWGVREEHAERRADGTSVLAEDTARRIARLARAVETSFGAPQDIEWALTGDTLYLLQARPITALPLKPNLPPLEGFWTKELEHFVPPVSPMLYSIHGPNIKEATTAACQSFGLLIESLELTYRAGEIYESDIPLGGDDGPAPPWWVLGIMSRVIPSMRKRMKQAAVAMRTDLEAQLLQRWDTEWKHELANVTAAHRQVDLTALNDRDLGQHLNSLRELTRRAFAIHFQIAFPCIIPVHRLARTCEELFGWDEHQAMRLLYGSSGGSSVGSNDLDRIADLIRKDPAAMELMTDQSVTIDRLNEEQPGVAAEVHAHLQQYGDRMIQNDPMSPTFLEVPALTLQFLRDRLTGASDARAQSATNIRNATEQEAEALLAMRSAEERGRFTHVLKRARWAYEMREANVYLTLAHPFALLRYALLEVGQRLQQRGILDLSTDVFYCTFEEARDAIVGLSQHGLGQTTKRRRLECLWTVANPGPAIIGTEPAAPDFRGLPREAREIHEAILWAVERVRAPMSNENSDGLRGVPASPGRYQGIVRIIRSERDFHRLQPGDVLVCPSTSSSWAVLFGTAGALVTDQGGSLSHPAIIAREHGIPAVVATIRATETLTDGQLVIVDGSTGQVEPVEAN